MRTFLTKVRVWFPPPLILVLFLVMDALTTTPRFTFGAVNIVVSLLLACVSLAVALHTVWQMRMKRTTLNPLHTERTTTLVTEGCYAWSRNPIYLGMSGLQLAFAFYVGSLAGILAVPLFMLVIARLHIDFEEEQLRKHFGPEWERYEQRVRRWL
ncbi:methyltransferase family protein [Citrobacter cronae]|uniref:methyltransferase family protein n=1 Tax=Citrobacter cronae TaxID=1748967 RepID=UPI0019006638|nr:isoprenylcysteine carboxylmethyltransferase family protein [Citrobacter cronae]MBJ8366572.1 isoprenylcysteine carboxylmethyltransferase family protein [Citrobacter cronae]MBJ8395475.1 isoprenylcysteine carboxylmethyltransferase family protein [Citrobacter cronae]MBJ8408342.1 isoprenylcysteine carboxylmethyltransferase family protein [Citrobacter cronae]